MRVETSALMQAFRRIVLAVVFVFALTLLFSILVYVIASSKRQTASVSLLEIASGTVFQFAPPLILTYFVGALQQRRLWAGPLICGSFATGYQFLSLKFGGNFLSFTAEYALTAFAVAAVLGAAAIALEVLVGKISA